MKSIRLLVFKIVLLCLVFSVQGYAQTTAVDKVIMVNGETKEGKVTAINDNSIKFVYNGESLEYEFKNADVSKIVFASGRTQIITAGGATGQEQLRQVSPTERKGKLAILPFGFVTNDAGIPTDGMSHNLQQSCADALTRDAARISVQDPMQTNALLAKNNVDVKNAILLDPKDLAGMLGVEFVVYGTTNLINKGSSTYGSDSTTYKEKKDKGKNSGTSYSSNVSTTTVNYETTVDIKIYNDQGSNVYNNNRQSFGSQLDSYIETIRYIMKRSPFGSKSK